MADKLGKLKVTRSEVRYGRQRGPLAGAHAVVSTSGGIDRKVSAGRFIMLGGIGGLIFKKKQDRRAVSVTVSGQGFEFVQMVQPQSEAGARQFAARLNTRAAKLGARQAPTPILLTGPPVVLPVPSQMAPGAYWAQDPAGRHEARYWDGTRWTEHVTDGGVVAVDPMPVG